MDILENGRMIGFDGLYKFRFIDMLYKVRKLNLYWQWGCWNPDFLHVIFTDGCECATYTHIGDLLFHYP